MTDNPDPNPADFWNFEDRFYNWLEEYNRQSGIVEALDPEQQRQQARHAYRRLVNILLSTPEVSAGFDTWLTEYNDTHRLTLPDAAAANRQLHRAAWLRFRDGYLLGVTEGQS